MKTTHWKPLHEQSQDVRYAIYQRLGLPIEQQHQEIGLWCRQCKNSFAAGSLRISSAPRPQWYETRCPSQLALKQYCEGSWEDFEHRKELRQ
jgi:hypothetical protein